MLSLLKNVTIRNSLIFTIGNIVNAGVPFLLLPILTRYMTPEEYGMLAMYTIVLGVMNAFTGLSVHGAISREYFEFDKLTFSKYIFNCLIILGVSTLFVSIVVFFEKETINRFTKIPSNWLLLIVIVSGLQFIQWIILSLLQVTEKGYQYISIQIGSSIIQFSLMVYFVVVLNMSWESKVIVQFIVFTISAIYTIYYLLKNEYLVISFRLDLLRNALKFGLPLIPHTLGMFVISFVDRILLTNLMNLEVVGVYTVGYQLGMFILVIQDAVNKAWVPWFYKQLTLGDEWRLKRIINYSYIISFSYLLLAFLYSYLIEIIVPILIGNSFLESIDIVIWISLGYAFNGMYKLVTNYIIYERKTGLLSIITFVTALLNIFVSVYYIKLNGMIGAAQGTMIAFGLSFIMTWICSYKIRPMPWLKTKKYV